MDVVTVETLHEWECLLIEREGADVCAAVSACVFVAPQFQSFVLVGLLLFCATHS